MLHEFSEALLSANESGQKAREQYEKCSSIVPMEFLQNATGE
jgi:hypothetical protein